MAKYLGCILKVGGTDRTYYYYNPVAEVISNDKSGISDLKMLYSKDLESLFPNVKRQSILLTYYRYKSQKSEMDATFANGSLAICEFNRTELDEHFSLKYGFTLPIVDYIRVGKVSFIDSQNIFHVVKNNHWMSDLFDKGIDKIYMQEFDDIPQTILCGEKIFVQCENDFLAGPCEVLRESSTGLLYVTPPTQNSKYILGGYDKNNFDEVDMYHVRYRNTVGKVFVLKNNERGFKDFITIQELFEDFKKSFVDIDRSADVDRAAIYNLVDSYSKSIFYGIPAEIKKLRLRRLEDALLESKNLSDEVGDLFANVVDKIPAIEETTIDISALKRVKLQLEDDIRLYTKLNDDLKQQNNKLQSANKTLKADFEELLNSSQMNMVKFAFDGFMANKLLDAAANFSVEDESAQYKNIADRVAAIPAQDKTPDDLVDYLCAMVKTVRPNYDANTIINLAICLTQGFLTVFYGEPGCGKTSICNIIADILGLNKISKIVEDNRANRYIPVSVEKGWTSKRDFTGYYNPLSKVFDKNNRRVYDALRLLDIEKNSCKFPCVILLDEANLSPMEHYWSDFMNICDGVDENSHVNLGEDNIFTIPATLKFVATINNDHTTENLSPRLIDRAWFISLSSRDVNLDFGNFQLPADKIEVVTWKSLREAFIPADDDYKNFPANIYQAIVEKFAEQNLSISPRVYNAVRNYCAAASKYFSENAVTIALDYAVSQRILPKIIGNGEDFLSWLEVLEKLFDEHSMLNSARIIRNIIKRGNNQLNYYGFFL